MDDFARRTVANVTIPHGCIITMINTLTSVQKITLSSRSLERINSLPADIAEEAIAVFDGIVNHTPPTIPEGTDQRVIKALAKNIILPTLEAMHVVAGTTKADSHEIHAIRLFNGLVSPTGAATPTFGRFITDAMDGMFPDNMREALTEETKIRIKYIQAIEPDIMTALTGGRPYGQAAQTEYGTRSLRRLMAYLAAPYIATVLYRELLIAPTLADLERTITAPTDAGFLLVRPASRPKRTRQ